jgi:hypothetical protein
LLQLEPALTLLLILVVRVLPNVDVDLEGLHTVG